MFSEKSGFWNDIKSGVIQNNLQISDFLRSLNADKITG